jgi:hypothetical protein
MWLSACRELRPAALGNPLPPAIAGISRQVLVGRAGQRADEPVVDATDTRPAWLQDYPRRLLHVRDVRRRDGVHSETVSSPRPAGLSRSGAARALSHHSLGMFTQRVVGKGFTAN